MSDRIVTLTGKFFDPKRELDDDEKALYPIFAKKWNVPHAPTSVEAMYFAMRFYNFLLMDKSNQKKDKVIPPRNGDLLDGTGIAQPQRGTARLQRNIPDVKQFLINEMQKDIGAAIPSASYYDASGNVSDPNATDTANAANDAQVISASEDLINLQLQKIGDQSLKQLVRLLNPWATRKHVYLCLDSKYATFSENNTKLTWDFTNSADQYANSANALGKVRDITMMKILSAVITQFPVNNFNRATICVEEWKTQSFKLPGGRNFHFVGLLNNLNAQVPLTSRSALTFFTIPDPITWNKYELLAGYRFNEGKYYFNNPITTINTMTLTFGNPIDLLNIQKYLNLNCRITNLGIGVDYAALTYINIQFPEPHYFPIEIVDPTIYSIYIQDFTTTNPVADKAVIDDINSTEFTLGYVDTTTTMYFNAFLVGLPGQPEIDWTPRTPPSPSVLVGAPLPCTVLLNGYRIIVNIDLEMND